MIRMANNGKPKQPLKQFHKSETKPRRPAFNVIRFFCQECGDRMKAEGTAERTTAYKCEGCGRCTKRSRGEDHEVRI